MGDTTKYDRICLHLFVPAKTLGGNTQVRPLAIRWLVFDKNAHSILCLRVEPSVDDILHNPSLQETAVALLLHPSSRSWTLLVAFSGRVVIITLLARFLDALNVACQFSD